MNRRASNRAVRTNDPVDDNVSLQLGVPAKTRLVARSNAAQVFPDDPLDLFPIDLTFQLDATPSGVDPDRASARHGCVRCKRLRSARIDSPQASLKHTAARTPVPTESTATRTTAVRTQTPRTPGLTDPSAMNCTERAYSVESCRVVHAEHGFGSVHHIQQSARLHRVSSRGPRKFDRTGFRVSLLDGLLADRPRERCKFISGATGITSCRRRGHRQSVRRRFVASA
jgi:hypothetical protein